MREISTDLAPTRYVQTIKIHSPQHANYIILPLFALLKRGKEIIMVRNIFRKI